MIWQLYFASLSVNISVMENPDSRKFVKLRTGALMPTLGMGTWHHGPKHEIHDALRKVFCVILPKKNILTLKSYNHLFSIIKSRDNLV